MNDPELQDMNRIQRIQTFLEDYKSLDPYLKDLIKPIHQDYQKKLIQEYLKVSRWESEEYLNRIERGSQDVFWFKFLLSSI